jgi:hypothetical protein
VSVLQQLAARMITVIAVNTGTGRFGLDGDPSLEGLAGDYIAADCAPDGREKQADDFSHWTGGALIEGLDVANIVAGINSVLDSIAPQVPAAQVRATGSAGQFVAQFSQVEFGPWQTAEAIQFNFDVTFFGIVGCDPNADQTFTGAIEVWIGDQLGAEKRLNVTVPRCKPTIVGDPVAITHWDKTSTHVELGSFVRGEHDALLSCFFHPSQNNFVWNRHDTSLLNPGEVIETLAVTYYGIDAANIYNDVNCFYVVVGGTRRRLMRMVGVPSTGAWSTREEYARATPLIGAWRIREHARPPPPGNDEWLFPIDDTVYLALIDIEADRQLYAKSYGHTAQNVYGYHDNRLLSNNLKPFVVECPGGGPGFFAIDEFSNLVVCAAQRGYFPHNNLWYNLGKQDPDGIVVNGPAVTRVRYGPAPNPQFAFVTYAQSGVAVNIWDGATGTWKLLGTPPGQSVQEVGQYGLTAVWFSERGGGANAFVFVNAAGRIFCCLGNDANSVWPWRSLGAPEDYVLTGSPSATVWDGSIYVFVRGVRRGQGHLFVCRFDGVSTFAWTDITETGVPLP